MTGICSGEVRAHIGRTIAALRPHNTRTFGRCAPSPVPSRPVPSRNYQWLRLVGGWLWLLRNSQPEDRNARARAREAQR